MAKNSTKVRGVEYWISPASGTTVTPIIQVTEFTPPPVTRPEEDETCHEDTSQQTTLGTPKAGAASITVIADLTNATHLRMRDAAIEASGTVWIAKGYANGTADPSTAAVASDFTYPTTRTYMSFECTLTNFREITAIGQNTKWQFDLVATGAPVFNDKA